MKAMVKQQKVRFDVPDDFTPEMRESLGIQFAEEIRRRSESGIDKDGKKFPKYSKRYTESLDFNNAGKSRNKVNLTLSGDMLIALDVLTHRSGSVTIGYEKDDDEMNGKVEGNRIGSYGGKPNATKARDFLGLPESVQEKLIRKVRRNF